VSWNIRAGGGRRLQDIADQLERLQPDVVALSEFRGTAPSQELKDLLQAQGLTYQVDISDPLKPATNSLLFASRVRGRRVRHVRAPVYERRWLCVKLATPVPLWIGVLHVPNYVTGRQLTFRDSILSLAQNWRSGACLIVGDTNSGLPDIEEENPIFGSAEVEWFGALAACGWEDAFRVLRGDERAYTWYSPNAGNGFRLDQAFANGEVMAHIKRVEYIWGRAPGGESRREALSDHAALLIDLEVPGIQGNCQTTTSHRLA